MKLLLTPRTAVHRPRSAPAPVVPSESTPDPADVLAVPGELPVLHHTFCALVARGSMLAARGLSLVLISRQLGGENFGVYALLLTTYNVILSMLGFGIDQVHLYDAGRRPDRVRLLTTNSLALGLMLGTAASLLFLTSIAVLRERIFTDVPALALVVTAVAFPVAILHNGLLGIVLGLGRFRYYGTVEALKWSAYLACIGALYAHHALGVASALASFYLVLLVAACVHLAVLRRRRALPRPSLPVLTETLRLGRSMLSVQLTHILSLRLDVYVVRALGSNLLVGTYALASNLGEILLYVSRSFSLVVFSGISRGGNQVLFHVRTLVHWLVVVACVLCTGLLVVHMDLLRLVFGEISVGSGRVLLFRMPGVLMAGISLLLAGELLGRGRWDLVAKGNAFSAVALGCLAALFARIDVGIGAAVAFTAAMALGLVWISTMLRRERRRESARSEFGAAQTSTLGAARAMRGACLQGDRSASAPGLTGTGCST